MPGNGASGRGKCGQFAPTLTARCELNEGQNLLGFGMPGSVTLRPSTQLVLWHPSRDSL